MEHTPETICLVEHKKRKKKAVFYNNKPNQVTSKTGKSNKIELNLIKQHLKINPCSSSNENMAVSSSNFTPFVCIDNTDLNHEYSTSSNSEPPPHLEQNDTSTVNLLTFHNISSDQNSNKSEISTSLEKKHCEDIVGQGKLIQFENSENEGFVSCRFCHLKFCYDISILIKHAKQCKQFNERGLKYILKFNCLICDKVFKRLTDWKSHTVSYCHLQKCMIQNDYVSYVCGGCKSVFFGSKDRISNHCKVIHRDISRLPCIYKCMKDVFHYFIFVDRKNLISWTFCGPCRIYSSSTVICDSQNHVNRKTKHFKCDSCLIDFVCSQDIYNNHLLSCEHIMLDYLRTSIPLFSNEKLESQTVCNLKLPPILLNHFSIDLDKATCNDCKFQMFPNEKAITVHLADECIYRTNIGRKNSKTIKTYFCAVCNITTLDCKEWKHHLITSSHLIKCYDKSDLVSYTCKLCSLHCYGDSHYVTEHQDIHPNTSEKNFSMFMAFNFQRINKDVKSEYFYYCEDCETYAEVNHNLKHWNKSHKAKLKKIVCHPCKTEFFCIIDNELFIKHELSSEHIILKYGAVKNQPLEQKTSLLTKSDKIAVLQNEDKKPCSSNSSLEIIKNQETFNFKPYLNWFKSVEHKNKADCIKCNYSIDKTEIALLNHLMLCDQDSSENISKTCINYFNCLECQFYSNNYDLWKKHAMSHIMAKLHFLYSYFCTSCSTLLYGKLNDIELHLHNEHNTTIMSMELETLLMGKLLKKKNSVCKTHDISFYCEPCQKIFKAIDNSNHFNTDSHASVASDLVELFFCKYCEVEFYSSSTVYERHKLTVEHIMMNLEYSSNDVKNVSKPNKLDAHLIKFAINQKLYDATQNIGFFCFVCNYLCTNLCTWKVHINGKKHFNYSKSVCIDHRCKICKTLMFGQRKHMFEHYSNRFHSMLRLFKSMKCTNISKQNDSLLQTTLETKPIFSKETTSEDIKNTGNGSNELEESTNNETNLCSKMMNELFLKESKVNNNETCSQIITVNQQDRNVEEESTTNINKTCSMIKMIDESLHESHESNAHQEFGETISNINKESLPDKFSLITNITQQEGNTLEKSNDYMDNEFHSNDELSLKINTQHNSNTLEQSTSLNQDLQSINKSPLKTNTKNYCNFYSLKIKIFNEMLSLNKDITQQIVYYCVPCDFITSLQNMWNDHILKYHLNDIEEIKVMVCDTCNLHQIGPSDNLDEHNTTIEHMQMLDFKKLYYANNGKKTNEIEENDDVAGISSNDARTSITDMQVKNNGKNDEKETINHKILVEIKGFKPKYKKNGWVELKKIFAVYGYFGIFPKQNSVIIIYRKLNSANQMIKDKEKLENTHEFTISVSYGEEKLPALNKTTEKEFGNKEILMKAINTQLEAINNEISNPNIIHRLHLLLIAIHRCGGQHFLACKTYAFGSRMSGLALKESDVDVYFDIANTFGGELSHDLQAQEDLVRYFGKVFRSLNLDFKNIQLITAARVPIVKFVHIPSGLNCDLSFKSGLSTHNTKLVRLYLTLDTRVHWIVCAVVKRWALQNDLKNQSMFTSYALVWLVLFYLMTIDVVPALQLLRQHANYSQIQSESDVMFIEDWDCTFCTVEKARQIWRVPEIPCWELLFGFFKFYSDFNRLKQFVLCPALGKALPKADFYKIPLNSPDIMGFYKKRIGRPSDWSRRLKDHFQGEGLAVQDPFDLFHNITRTIVPKKLQGFSHLCTKTMEVMNNGVQPYYA